MAVGDLKARLQAKFTRCYPATQLISSTDGESQLPDPKTNSLSSPNSRAGHTKHYSFLSNTIIRKKEDAVSETPELGAVPQGSSAWELATICNRSGSRPQLIF
jgi:hypothetical protein